MFPFEHEIRNRRMGNVFIKDTRQLLTYLGICTQNNLSLYTFIKCTNQRYLFNILPLAS